MLATLLLAAAAAALPPADVRIENGVRVHRMQSPAVSPAMPEPETRVRIDPGYRGTELYRPSRFEIYDGYAGPGAPILFWPILPVYGHPQ